MARNRDIPSDSITAFGGALQRGVRGRMRMEENERQAGRRTGQDRTGQDRTGQDRTIYSKPPVQETSFSAQIALRNVRRQVSARTAGGVQALPKFT